MPGKPRSQICRRAAFSLVAGAVPAIVWATSGAEGRPSGMERHEARRDVRVEQREDRRDVRSGVVVQPATTGSTAPPSVSPGAGEGHTYHGGPKFND